MLSTELEKTSALLLRWAINAKRSQIANYEAANHFSSLNLRLGIPVVIVTAVVGTSVFASLQSENINVWLKILIGLISILATVLASLQTFMGYGDRAAKHRAIAADYGAVKRLAQEALATHIDDMQMLKKTLEVVRTRLDHLAKESPSLPDGIWQKSLRIIPDSWDLANLLAEDEI